MLDILRPDIDQFLSEGIAPLHLTARQEVPLENRFNSLNVKLRRNVHYSIVFIIEISVKVGRFAISLDQMLEKFHMRADMAVEVHRHKAG